MYNYNFKNPIVTKNNMDYYVKEKNKIYLFKLVQIEEIKYLNYTNKDPSFYKCLKNIDNQYVTYYQKKSYILLEINNKIEISFEEIQQDNMLDNINDHKKTWLELWKNKIDKIENNIKSNNQTSFLETNDYYLGMAENALCFLEYNKEYINSKQLSICRKRINNKNYRLPNNAIIDYKERDFAEYIKYLFFSKNEKESLNFLKKINFNKYNKYLVFARLLLPTYYFDLVEDTLITNKDEQQALNNFIKKVDSYEMLLSKICQILFEDQIEIEWLKKSKY